MMPPYQCCPDIPTICYTKQVHCPEYARDNLIQTRTGSKYTIQSMLVVIWFRHRREAIESDWSLFFRHSVITALDRPTASGAVVCALLVGAALGLRQHMQMHDLTNQ
jgi:hypothetical protein